MSKMKTNGTETISDEGAIVKKAGPLVAQLIEKSSRGAKCSRASLCRLCLLRLVTSVPSFVVAAHCGKLSWTWCSSICATAIWRRSGTASVGTSIVSNNC